MLHRLFSRFDAAVARRGYFKMDTVRAPVGAVCARARGEGCDSAPRTGGIETLAGNLVFGRLAEMMATNTAAAGAGRRRLRGGSTPASSRGRRRSGRGGGGGGGGVRGAAVGGRGDAGGDGGVPPGHGPGGGLQNRRVLRDRHRRGAGSAPAPPPHLRSGARCPAAGHGVALVLGLARRATIPRLLQCDHTTVARPNVQRAWTAVTYAREAVCG